MSARFIVADVFAGLASLEDDSVDLVFSSPPFLALRSYLPAEHPDKAKEIGSEATPAGFLDTLLDVVEACDRVLAPHGSLCFELGDTFSGSGGAGGDYTAGGLRDGQEAFSGSAAKRRRLGVGDEYRPNRNGRRNRPADVAAGILPPLSRPGPEGRDEIAGWPLDKSLCLIPTLFAASLAYGYNMLRPERTTARWRIRNLVVWARPNPPVGALGDKFRPATSYLTVATKARSRYFDLDAVRTPAPRTDNRRTTSTQYQAPGQPERKTRASDDDGARLYANEAGAPPLDYWVIPTAPYRGSHYATFPPELVVKPVKAMCPLKVCRVCGEPSRRITEAFTLDSYRASTRPQTIKAVKLADEHGLTDEHIAAVRAFGTSDAGKAIALNSGAGKNSDEVKRLAAEAKAVLGGYFREFVMSTNAERESGWTDCDCLREAYLPAAGGTSVEPRDKYRAGCVLDPFAGSGVTLAVATGHGRDAIGIDLDARNADLARERVGMFLTVEHLNAEPAA